MQNRPKSLATIAMITALLSLFGGCNKDKKSEVSNQESSSAPAVKAKEMKIGANGLSLVKVVLKTTKGDFAIQFYPQKAPNTVTRFLKLVGKNFYDGITFHRVIPGFVIQGGGFSVDASGIFNATPVTTDPAVLNEPGISNIRGTIAMAKLGNDPNSATSQWFFNLSDNSANLDFQNGGFDTLLPDATFAVDVNKRRLIDNDPSCP